MNRNIPERFDKDKIYYSYSESGGTGYRYYYSNGWKCVNSYDYREADLESTVQLMGLLWFDEVFITEEEYEDVLLMQELKK